MFDSDCKCIAYHCQAKGPESVEIIYSVTDQESD